MEGVSTSEAPCGGRRDAGPCAPVCVPGASVVTPMWESGDHASYNRDSSFWVLFFVFSVFCPFHIYDPTEVQPASLSFPTIKYENRMRGPELATQDFASVKSNEFLAFSFVTVLRNSSIFTHPEFFIYFRRVFSHK